MDISELNQNFSKVIKEIDKTGIMIVNKYNNPSYVLMTIDFFENLKKYFDCINSLQINQKESNALTPTMTLHEAMICVLNEQPNKIMRYNEIADEIWKRKLYTKHNGQKATSGQILLRAKNYKNLFEIVDNYYVSLR